MTGTFGVVGGENVFSDVFFGTDYHSHLGTQFGGIAVADGPEVKEEVQEIKRHSFRSRLEQHGDRLKGKMGIGVISDSEPQPLIFLGSNSAFALSHVGKVANLETLATKFGEEDDVNPVRVIGHLINEGTDIVDGLEIAQNTIEGSSSLMALTGEGIYLSRDRLGRTPIIIGKKNGATAATMETTAFPNLGFETERELGPGEIGIMTEEGYEQLKEPGEEMNICTFLWIYYGFPVSTFEGINVDGVRHRCGIALAKRDLEVDPGMVSRLDMAAGIPDSGTGHGHGYSNGAQLPFRVPYQKYTPTWPRSFMPQSQEMRDLVAEMKLIPNRGLIENMCLLFTEDSVVRGTQLKNKIQVLKREYGAREIHVRPACPPLTHMCQYLNFSRSRDEFDLAARRAIRSIEGDDIEDISVYLDEGSSKYESMVNWIGDDIGADSLRFQRMDDMVEAIGLSKEKLCMGCWRPCEGGGCEG